jgi:RIO-like serine/threonine protein kinase
MQECIIKLNKKGLKCFFANSKNRAVAAARLTGTWFSILINMD